MPRARTQQFITPLSTLLDTIFSDWGRANVSTPSPTYQQLAPAVGLNKHTLMMLMTGRRMQVNRPTISKLEKFIRSNFSESYSVELIKKLHKANSSEASQKSVESDYFERLLS